MLRGDSEYFTDWTTTFGPLFGSTILAGDCISVIFRTVSSFDINGADFNFNMRVSG